MTSTTESGELLTPIDSQIIMLQGESSNIYKINSKETEIRASKALSQTHATIASNKIKVNKLISYDWEQKYHCGNLIAVHKNDEFCAYSLRGKKAGTIRVFHKKSSERALIQSFTGRIIDLSFAYYNEAILGVIDESASVQIFKLELDSATKIQSTLLFNVKSSISAENLNRVSDMFRIIWCMYIPDAEQTNEINIAEDASKVFVVTNDKQADIYHLDLIRQNYDTSQPLKSDDIEKGHLCINEHNATILTAAFSPDGSAIATACHNGDVNFFKISFADAQSTPTCLQQWQPHGSKPVTSLYFLDDHKNPSPNAQFWSYILTGCDYNREIKLWCCIKWQCLQTIRFTSENEETLPLLKTAIDLSSTYLLMSDITRKVFYVLHLSQDAENAAKVFAISEYALVYPAISFAIIESSRIKPKKFTKITSSASSENIVEDDVDNLMTMIRLYCIQTKQLQEMQIIDCPESTQNNVLYSPSVFNNFNQRLTSSVSFNSDIKDRLSDVLSDLEQDLNSSRSNIAAIAGAATNVSNSSSFTLNKDVAVNNNPILQINLGSNSSTPTTILMTPDAFSNTPRRINSDLSAKQTSGGGDAIIQSFMSTSSRASSLTHVTACANNANATNSNGITNTNNNILTSNQSGGGGSGGNISNSNSNTNKLSMQTAFLPSSTPNLENIEKPTSDERILLPKYEPKRIVSSSSESSESGSSSSSSSGLSDAADKEIEAISLPVDNEDNKTVIQPSDENTLEDYINGNISPKIAVGTNSSNLLNKVDIDNYENEIDSNLAQKSESSIVKDDNELNSMDNQSARWPNPPLLDTGVNSLKRNRSSNEQQNTTEYDSNLLADLMYMLRQQQSTIEMLQKQQLNSFVSLKSHFDASIQAIRMQQQQQALQSSSGATNSSILLNEEHLATILNQTLTTQILPKLEKYVKDEIKQTVQPQVMKVIEPFKEQIPRELAEKLKATENALKDSVVKIVKSKTLVDSISQSVGNTIQATVLNLYRDTFQKVIIPSFEKSCQNMYQQINATFKKGTDEYLQEFDNFLKQQRKTYEEQKDPLINQIKQYNDGFQTNMQQLSTTLMNNFKLQMDQTLHNGQAVMQDTIISSVKAIIKEELNVAMRDQQQHLPERLVTLMRQSGTMTPVVYGAGGNELHSELDTKQLVLAFAQKGHLDSAFKKALCASDLNILVALLENVNPQQLSEQRPCPLTQPVLLSLIQQLSQDLNSHTELKLKYLEEALMNLDQTQVITREHIPNVVQTLVQKVSQYIQTHPNDKYIKPMKMLLMAAQSLFRG